MITVIFNCCGDLVCGFKINGHSGYAEEGQDIICSAVSSASIMTANTITEVQHINAEITENDGFLSLNLSKDEAKKAEVVLSGLKLHLTALSEQFKEYIKVKISEV